MTLSAQPLTLTKPVAPAGATTTPHLNMTLPRIAPSAPVTQTGAPQNPTQKILERMHHAAHLVRAGFPYEALSEFENILNQWRRTPEATFSVFAAKAAYNRAVLFETMLSDNARALIAFEEAFKWFQDHGSSEIRTVAVRAGLHAARLVGVKKNYAESAARYHSRLPLATDLLPPRELGAFVDHFRRMVDRTKAQQTSAPHIPAANQPIAGLGDLFKSTTKAAEWSSELRKEWAELRSLVSSALERLLQVNLPPEQFLDTIKHQHKQTLDLVHSRFLDLKDQQLMTHALVRQEFKRIASEFHLLRRTLYGSVVLLGLFIGALAFFK